MNQAEAPETQVIIYVGTHKLVAIEGRLDRGETRVLNLVTMKNPDGFDKGFVSNLERAISSIEQLVKPFVRAGSGLSAFVVLGNSKLQSGSFSSSQYYQGFQRTISSQEIRQVVSQTRSVATLPLSEFVLQAVPESFLVNDMTGIKNPVGLEAYRLGVQLKIHTMNFQDFKNISKAFEAAEVDVEGYFPRTLTAPEAVLSEQEKNEGALFVDIADDCTYVTLWKDGCLVDTTILPSGGRSLSAQIAGDWGIEIADAQKVKERYATLNFDTDFKEELIPLVERGASRQILKREFQEKFIVQAEKWMSEILTQVDAFSQAKRVFHPHLVFGGGGVSLDGFLEFLQKKFSRSARVGLVRRLEASNEYLVDPSLVSIFGMLRMLAGSVPDQKRLLEPQGFLQKTLASARDWFFAYF